MPRPPRKWAPGRAVGGIAWLRARRWVDYGQPNSVGKPPEGGAGLQRRRGRGDTSDLDALHPRHEGLCRLQCPRLGRGLAPRPARSGLLSFLAAVGRPGRRPWRWRPLLRWSRSGCARCRWPCGGVRPARCMMNHGAARAWWPAVGVPVERPARPHFAALACVSPAARPATPWAQRWRGFATQARLLAMRQRPRDPVESPLAPLRASYSAHECGAGLRSWNWCPFRRWLFLGSSQSSERLRPALQRLRPWPPQSRLR